MTPEVFVSKWNASELKERSASQSHFNDLCTVLDEPTPTDADPKGEWYCFERGASKTTGGEGWADVWKRHFFGWEYKGKRKDLDAAFVQLQQYAVALENPPLLVVCDMERFRVHTNWTNTVSEVHEFVLNDLLNAENRAILKAVLSNPEQLKPKLTRDALTEQVASEFAALALDLRERGHDPQTVAHFINRLVFCMFAEDVSLLPNSLFTEMLSATLHHPDDFQSNAQQLFAGMQSGGVVAFKKVEWFNGGLFDSDEALPLTRGEIELVLRAARMNWSEIDPSILGTLFERGLDPDKRSQLGAHYTDRDKIMMIIEPVILRPLEQEWSEVRAKIAKEMDKASDAKARRPKTQAEAKKVYRAARQAEERALRNARRTLNEFMEHLRAFRVLDPACGSGNFLYLALQTLKDFEHRVLLDAEALGLDRAAPSIGPEVVKGIEINLYAAELARVTVWIGEIQWMKRNGFDVSRNPILKPLDTIECRDAVLNNEETEASWPEADVIIGNPPFLGAKLMKRWLGLEYTETLRKAYEGRLRGFSDLVCYWFEKARAEIITGRVSRAGLVATSSIRGGTNRPVMDRIARESVIYEAWSKQPWTVEGARVEVSIVCFCGAASSVRKLSLDGVAVPNINPDLTTGLDLTRAVPLDENVNTSFLGIQKSGPLDIDGTLSRQMMQLPSNPNGKHNAEILKPYWNGDDLTARPRDVWLIDFPLGLTEFEAALYERAYEYLRCARYSPENPKDERLLPDARATARDSHAQSQWWEPYWPRPEMRQLIEQMPRYIVTAETSEHRLFVWLSYPVLPDKNLIVIARSDDVTFGVLHSRFHEAWALRLGTSLEDRPRYTSTTTFATFPFPDGLTPNIPASKFADTSHTKAITVTAQKLVNSREAWLYPHDLVFREPEVVPGFPERILPVDDKAAATLKKRTLTNLYNERPAWLDNAHRELDEAVAKAYGWPIDMDDDEILRRLFELNQERAGHGPV